MVTEVTGQWLPFEEDVPINHAGERRVGQR